jgi:hypothetical protein
VGEAQAIQLIYKSRTAYLSVFAFISKQIRLQLSAVRGAEKIASVSARARTLASFFLKTHSHSHTFLS